MKKLHDVQQLAVLRELEGQLDALRKGKGEGKGKGKKDKASAKARQNAQAG